MTKYYVPVFILIFGFTFSACTLQATDTTTIQASGSIEAVEVVISAETGGRVAEVFVTKGQSVEPGDALFRLEDEQLDSQWKQAETALAVAQANYNLVAAGQTEAQKQAAIAAAHLNLLTAQQALDNLYDNNAIALAQAKQAIAEAQKAIQDAGRRVNSLSQSATQADIDQAFANMILAKDKLDDAKDDYQDYAAKPEDNLERAAHLSVMAQAQKVYDAAVRLYNNLSGTGDEIDIARAEADMSMAQALLAQARKDHDILLNGPNPDDVALAEAQVALAEAQVALAGEEFPSPEQLAVAQAQVDAAAASLDAIQTQTKKLIVSTPIGGVVTVRNLETGETIQPGLATLTISQIERLTVTVYIPENQYGQINLGDTAKLKVDSFPLQSFDAVVTRIADRAEYTPRNVQTQEERQTTVYAVELQVEDPDGKLKPGMPSDVVFGE